MMQTFYNKIKERIYNKRILILGFGREGRATLKVLGDVGGYSRVGIADLNPIDESTIDFKDHISLHFGESYQEALNDYDLVFKSPGVVLDNLDNIHKITSETDEMLSFFKNQIIGITGTKGKSTTTALIYHVLRKYNENCVLMGNIGIPAFEMINKIDEKTIIVYELSCHQLEYAKTSPHIGVLLNIFPEHLDHYGTFLKYKAAKENVYANMKKGDELFCNLSVAPILHEFNLMTFSYKENDADCVVLEEKTICDGKEYKFVGINNQLLGIHSLYNISIAFFLTRLFNVTEEEFFLALKTFKPLPHRLENIGTVDTITYFDDSISTIPETTIEAISSVKNVGTLILGGMDRGISFNLLVEYLIKNPIPIIILMPDTGKRIYNELKGKTKSKLYLVGDLEEAVLTAKKYTAKNTSCVLSPASASYGFFKNFEERGDCFKKYVFNQE